MFLNTILSYSQKIFEPFYNKSFFLQKIDLLIGADVLLLILSATFAQSDFIGYFGLFAILLTIVKIFTKKGEGFELNAADKFLLAYFMFVIISVAGSSLFCLSLKGFFKTLTYLGFYVAMVHYFKDNKDKIKYIFFAYAICIAIETVAAFMQNFLSVGEISGWQDTSRLNPEEVMTRVYGTLKPYNPNLFGGYLLACIPALIALPKRFGFPLGVVSASALIFTGCRGAYIAFFAQLAVLSVFIYKALEPKLKRFFVILASCLVLVLSFVIVSITSLRSRIFSIFAIRSDSSN